MFQPFCFNHIITDLSFMYYKAGLTRFRAIEHMVTRMRACEQLQKVCEHEQVQVTNGVI